jgi:D-hydroxyproline dehydrogenase subunit alpha
MRHRVDVLVVGAGPAGIAAAVRAAEEGRRVGLVDENALAGGQIWRGFHEKYAAAGEWIGRLEPSEVERFFGWRVFDSPVAGVLRAGRGSETAEFEFGALVMATGARERLLPFPGWTLPNVMGAGGLQAMVKAGLPIAGKRVVVAGTGPLLIAVTAFLVEREAEVLTVCEQASLGSLARLGVGLVGHSSKLADAVRYGWRSRGVRLSTGCWVRAAFGVERLERVVLNDGRELVVDYLACGFHLVPNCELAMLMGCAVDGGFVKVDEWQRSSVKDVFCAGEPTGIGGVEAALVEGEIAGLVAAGVAEKAKGLLARRDSTRRFAGLLDRVYRLNPELGKLADAETIVCRCEDVTMGEVRAHSSWRDAKLQARVGMGACQGRVCGAACEFLFGWGMESVRPPIQPTPIGSLVGISAGDS